MPAARPIEERFLEKVDKEGPVPAHCPELGPCWVWRGTTTRGYGQVRMNGRVEKAHRVSWLLHRGEIPKKKEVCHHCDHKPCVRPTHLYVATHAENMRDAGLRGLVTPPKGTLHHLNARPETRLYGDRNGARTKPETRARGENNGSRLYPERLKRGASHPLAKLTDDAVRELRDLYATGEYRQCDLAEAYGIRQAALSSIVRRKTWAHVK